MALKKVTFVCERCGHGQYNADFDVCPACGWSHLHKKNMWKPTDYSHTAKTFTPIVKYLDEKMDKMEKRLKEYIEKRTDLNVR